MFLFESAVSKICLITFLISGGVILYIGQYKVPTVTKKTQLARTLTLGLWGFVPPHIDEIVHQRNVWNWRKLFVCGTCYISGDKQSQMRLT